MTAMACSARVDGPGSQRRRLRFRSVAIACGVVALPPAMAAGRSLAARAGCRGDRTRMERQVIHYGGGACHGLMQTRADRGYVIPECAGIWEIRYERAQGSVARAVGRPGKEESICV